MKPVDDLDIGLEETVPAGIAVERMFDQTLDGLNLHTENFGGLCGLLILFHASGPTKILRPVRSRGSKRKPSSPKSRVSRPSTSWGVSWVRGTTATGRR